MPFQRLRVKTIRMPGATILVLEGRLDAATVGKLIAAVDEVKAPLVGRLVLDMGEVSDVDMAGLGGLAHAARAARDHDRRARLVNLQPPVRQRLTTAGLADAFRLHEDLTDALGDHEPPTPGTSA
ncbi:STAS domain-containing protein [Longispora sp. K20-0274]|uniref:STAS domain-containing protein n=1 Tax=Longispora sp. K20-0274 TaxID=3088255 RepID=UPI00399C3436